METKTLTQSNYQSELSHENTIYEIYETIVFSGTFTIPHNSILRFCGGKLVGTTATDNNSIDLTNCGTICSDRCIIEAPLVKVFDRVKFSGDFLYGQVFQIEWFVDKYESAFNPNSVIDSSIEINRALISGIHKIHFNNDRYYHIKNTITLTGNLDISGEKTHVDAGHNWYLRVPCIYSTEISSLFTYNYVAGHGIPSKSKPRLSIEGLNFCCAKQPNTFEDSAIVEINNDSDTTLWGLYIDINIVSSNGTSSITDNYAYTGLKIMAMPNSIAFIDFHGSVSSVYQAYYVDKQETVGDIDNYVNDVKIWGNTACVRGGIFAGGFPVKNFGSHQMLYGFNEKYNGKGYFVSQQFDNYGYIWDAMSSPKTNNTIWTCQYIATPLEDSAMFHVDDTQTVHRDAEIAMPTDAFFPNLLADKTAKYNGIGITFNRQIKSYKKTSPTVEDSSGLSFLNFKRYEFPKHLCRWDSVRYFNSIHSDIGYSYNNGQSDYEYQYEASITFKKSNYSLGQYQDNPPLYICPCRTHEDFIIVVKYYDSESSAIQKTVQIGPGNYNAYRYGWFIRIPEIFLKWDAQTNMTVVEFRQRIINDSAIISRPMFFVPNYHATDVVRVGSDSDLPDMTAQDAGEMFFHTTNGQLWWNGNKWVERDGASAGVRRSGTYAQKPAGNSIYVGFRYFCISGATVQGNSMTNIEIFYTGSGWVDALGRTVS